MSVLLSGLVEKVKELSYREKLKLAQKLIQMACIEEERLNSASQAEETETIKKRLLKSEPAKYDALTNFIKAMYNFNGGIEDAKVTKIIEDLQKSKFIRLDKNKVEYLTIEKTLSK